MTSPKVSVILPAFNAEKFVEKSLRSLMEQTFDDVEFLVIDDCSTDNTLAIIKTTINEYPQRLSQTKVFTMPENKGIAAVRAFGINTATGDYTIQIDSDDYCELDMIESLYCEAIKNNADMVICDFYINFPKKQIYKSQKTPESSIKVMSGLVNSKLHGATWNKLIKRSLYIDNHINFTPDLNMWEDLSTVIKLSYFAKKIAYLPEAFLHHTKINPASYTLNVSLNSLNNMKQAIEDIEQFLIQNNVYEQLKEDLMCLKLFAKREWLVNTKGETQKESINLYPETNPYILKYKSNPIYYRYAQWLASKNCFWITNMLLKLVKFGKKMR
jgi:glycosyltransferase involved in cell wall biosynthesis